MPKRLIFLLSIFAVLLMSPRAVLGVGVSPSLVEVTLPPGQSVTTGLNIVRAHTEATDGAVLSFSNSVAKFVTTAPEKLRVVLPAGERLVYVPFTITLPPEAQGDYNGTIQVLYEGSPLAGSGNGVQIGLLVGLHIIVGSPKPTESTPITLSPLPPTPVPLPAVPLVAAPAADPAQSLSKLILILGVGFLISSLLALLTLRRYFGEKRNNTK